MNVETWQTMKKCEIVIISLCSSWEDWMWGCVKLTHCARLDNSFQWYK